MPDTIFEWIIFVLLILYSAVMLFTVARWLIYYFSEKEKALVGSKQLLILDLIVIVILAGTCIINRSNETIWWMYGVTALSDLCSMPASVFNILTPKGVCRHFSIAPKYILVSDLSYEFRDDHLELRFTHLAEKNVMKYNIGIKNIKTVKMLADYYPKHDMHNPLLPNE